VDAKQFTMQKEEGITLFDPDHQEQACSQTAWRMSYRVSTYRVMLLESKTKVGLGQYLWSSARRMAAIR
jgi:hypothetical protein